MNILLITGKGTKVLTLHENPDNDYQKELDFRIFSVFADGEIEKNDDAKLITMKISTFSKMTEEKKDKAKELSDLYQEKLPRINRIRKFIEDIPVGDYFVIFPEEGITTIPYLYLLDSIDKLNNKKIDLETLLQEKMPLDQYVELFGDVLRFYEISSPPPRIGEPDKTKRICIFCNKSNKLTTFQHDAHLIPQSLGNKKYIQYEECDSCNNRFGRTIDNALTEFLNPYRILYNLGRKDGLEIRYRSYSSIERKNDQNLEIKFFDDKKMASNSPPPSKLEFIPLTKYKPQDVYRALARIAISCLNKQERTFFPNAISWINGEISKQIVPKIFKRITNTAIEEDPHILLYKKRTDVIEENYPCLISELHLQNIIFVYIVQNDNELNKFMEFEDIIGFWKIMKHYGEIEKWEQIDLSSDNFIETKLNLEFKQIEPNHPEEVPNPLTISPII